MEEAEAAEVRKLLLAASPCLRRSKRVRKPVTMYATPISSRV